MLMTMTMAMAMVVAMMVALVGCVWLTKSNEKHVEVLLGHSIRLAQYHTRLVRLLSPRNLRSGLGSG